MRTFTFSLILNLHDSELFALIYYIREIHTLKNDIKINLTNEVIINLTNEFIFL